MGRPAGLPAPCMRNACPAEQGRSSRLLQHQSHPTANLQLAQQPGRSQAAMSEGALSGPPAAVVSGSNRGLGLEVRGHDRPAADSPLPGRRRRRRPPPPLPPRPSAAAVPPKPARPFVPSPPLQLCRQLRQRGWRVYALCRSSSAELDALSTPPAGATNQQQVDGESGGSLTVVQGIDVASDGCVAFLQVRGVAVVQLGCRGCCRSVRNPGT